MVRAVVALVLTAATAPATPEQPATLADWSRSELDRIETVAGDNGDFRAAAEGAERVLLTLVIYSAHPDEDAVRRVGLAHRHYDQMSQLDDEVARRLHGFLQEHPEVRDAVAALLRERDDDIEKAYAVLDELREEYGERLGDVPELVAALCVVFDAGTTPPLIEQHIEHPAGAGDVFAHLTGASAYLRDDPRSLPGELLVHVVDVNVSADDLWWAAQRYRNSGVAGKSYHDVPYDTRSFKQGADLRLDTAMEREPLSLPLIQRVGGVCRHQGFYAANVGKAIGVPTVWARADGPDLGHAWVGYLRNGAWDFDEGRYDDYEKVRGEIRDPQSGRIVGDQRIGILADLLHYSTDRRRLCTAYIEASRLVSSSKPRPPDPLAGSPDRRTGDALPEPRSSTVETRLWLLEQGLRACPPDLRGWDELAEWAPMLDDDARRFWFDVVYRLAGRRYPDVMLDVLRPMIRGIGDDDDRDKAWAWAMEHVRSCPQLVVELAVERGRSREQAGDREGAWSMYTSAARTYPSEGPFVLEALRSAENMLGKDQLSYMVDLYADVFRRVARPNSRLSEVYRPSSMYYRIGSRYARVLERAGQKGKAESVRDQIKR